jgi:3-hydroxyisobutyrate dehydrogenase
VTPEPGGERPASELGFIGLGLMGEPMARTLLRAGRPLVVWNRSPAPCLALRELGAQVAAGRDQVFARCEVVVLMLADEAAQDEVLGRGTDRFAGLVRGRILVSAGTAAPAYSEGLAADVAAAGGRYVEAPVSGSRLPAERGELLAMLAGEDDAIDVVAALLAPLWQRSVRCGPVPRALLTKLAVNTVLITTVVGLVEAHHFAETHGLDLAAFHEVVGHGQMASEVSRLKAATLLTGDLSAQAAATDVWRNCRMIRDSADRAGASAPLIAACEALYADTVARGRGLEDMAAVIDALREFDTNRATPPTGRLTPPAARERPSTAAR